MISILEPVEKNEKILERFEENIINGNGKRLLKVCERVLQTERNQ